MKNDATMLKGCIIGMTDMGAIFHNMDDFDIMFKIPATSELNDIEKLRKAKKVFLNFGLTLKVCYIK